MALSSEQSRTLDATNAYFGCIPNFYAGMVMTRDGRITADTQVVNGRPLDPSCLNLETDDDPADLIEQVKVADAVVDEKGKETKAAEFQEQRTKRANDSSLLAQPTVDLAAKAEAIAVEVEK